MTEEGLLEMPAAKKRKVDYSEASCSRSVNSEASCSADSSHNFVHPEEVKWLKEFSVLDEVKSNDEDSKEEESDGSDGMSEDELEKMLDENLPDDFKGAPKKKEKNYIIEEKTVLDEKGDNHLEVLPLDWIKLRHMSGMPIYLHRPSRVCTLSKPYFIGKEAARYHEIPISAIPCLAYRRALEEEDKQKEIDKQIADQIRTGNWGINSNVQSENCENGHDWEDITRETIQFNYTPIKEQVAEDTMKCPFRNGRAGGRGEEAKAKWNEDTAVERSEASGGNKPEEGLGDDGTASTIEGVLPKKFKRDEQVSLARQPVVLPGGIVMPPPRVETISTSWKTQHLTAEQIKEYCSRLFKFKTLTFKKFKSWSDRRKHMKARRHFQYPKLPKSAKLITIPAPSIAPGEKNVGGKASKRDWVMNISGRSCLSLFHEYVRRAMHNEPVYEFQELESAATPYEVTVYIGGMVYGVGHGTSKRQAKTAAARNSMQILIPEMKHELDVRSNDQGETDLNFFDCVGIEDPRIMEFCINTCEPSPHAILRTCLQRNFGASDQQIHTEIKNLPHQKVKLTMKVGKHSATVVDKNMKSAKQRASQAILQALHPQVRSWGALLRLYGTSSVKSNKEQKEEEREIILLQERARQNQPNFAVLEKLRDEMMKLRMRDEARVPIGSLLVPEDLPTHSGSNLNDLEL